MKIPTRLEFGVVVLNYHALETTRQCIDSILDLEDPPREIVLVDNAADDDSIAAFEEFYGRNRRVKRFHFPENRGYTGGNNIGIAYLLEREIDVICLLNNDTRILPGFFARLGEGFASPAKPDILSPLILFEDERTIWSTGEKTLYPFLLSRTDRGRSYTSGAASNKPVNCVTGCAMAVKRRVFQKIGLLDDAFFAYVEDVDFCKRALDAGFAIGACLEARVVHMVSGTAGHQSPVQLYLKSRNRAYFIRKNVSFALRPAAYAWYLLLNLMWGVRHAARGDYRAVRAIANGMADWQKGRMGAGRVEEFLRPTQDRVGRK